MFPQGKGARILGWEKKGIKWALSGVIWIERKYSKFFIKIAGFWCLEITRSITEV